MLGTRPEVSSLKDQEYRDARHNLGRSITSCSFALIVPIFDGGAAFQLRSTPIPGVSCLIDASPQASYSQLPNFYAFSMRITYAQLRNLSEPLTAYESPP
jgi:hypothetical protein